MKTLTQPFFTRAALPLAIACASGALALVTPAGPAQAQGTAVANAASSQLEEIVGPRGAGPRTFHGCPSR